MAHGKKWQRVGWLAFFLMNNMELLAICTTALIYSAVNELGTQIAPAAQGSIVEN